ncbi:hypothetical protein DFJ73DRAFT_865199 [Zopfochytrium polystomum]|nr:hypothetical protein DFJ73DRAFT_865199 [Zopfochytrium polystomum]
MTKISSLLAAFVAVASLAVTPSLAAYPQVDGNFTITVTNQPASNQYCVGDSIAFALDLGNIPKSNPQNKSDATYVSVLVMGPAQDPAVDPAGLSKTPRGLVLGALGFTPVSTFAGSATYTVDKRLKGFTGLFLRAIVSYESQFALFESFQTAAATKVPFSVALDCAPAGSSSATSYGGATTRTAQNGTSSILYSAAVGGVAPASRSAVVAAAAAVPLLMLFA